MPATNKQKSLRIPQTWQEWANKYLEENKHELEALGIHNITELFWRLNDLGKPELQELVNFLQTRQKQTRPTALLHDRL